jgi:hypothetical protein
MNLPTEIIYKIAEYSDEYIETLRKFKIEPRKEDWKIGFKKTLDYIIEKDVFYVIKNLL